MLAALLAAACTGRVTQAPDAAAAPSEPDAEVASFPLDCAPIYGQDHLPTFEIEIDPAEWEALQEELATWQQRQEQGLPLKPYHPLIAFRYGADVATDAMVRLRGNPCCSWDQEKLQLQISFNEIDPDARFHGLRKIALDAPGYNRSYLRERVALFILRDAGLPAPCANNARLVVNGEYYGLYTNLEKVDREFLERNFDLPDGNLFKKGRRLETNEETGDTARAEAFWATTDVAELDALVDLDEAVLEWAGEAAIPSNDGYWAGGGNFYLYDHPVRGLVFIPWDFDSTFEVLPADTDLAWEKPDSVGHPQLDAVLADPTWRSRFIDAVDTVLDSYDPDALAALVDVWSAQIRDAAEGDPSRSFTFQSHLISVENLRAYFAPRAAFLRAWVDAQRP